MSKIAIYILNNTYLLFFIQDRKIINMFLYQLIVGWLFVFFTNVLFISIYEKNEKHKKIFSIPFIIMPKRPFINNNYAIKK